MQIYLNIIKKLFFIFNSLIIHIRLIVSQNALLRYKINWFDISIYSGCKNLNFGLFFSLVAKLKSDRIDFKIIIMKTLY
jgi:hypothetical protein